MTNRAKQVPEYYTLSSDVPIKSTSGDPLLDTSNVADSDAGIDSVSDALSDREPQPSMSWMLLRELVETVVLSLVIFLLIRQVVQNYRIESHSMEPNFYEGQFILVNKLAFRLGAPERGDVVVFHNPNNEEEDYIKRVIGLPGDNFEIRDGAILIDGKPLPEEYPVKEIARTVPYGPIVIEPDHLFVMGDNRPQSQDSRYFGQLSEDLLVGKAWVRVWPFNEFGIIQHYDLEPNAASAGGS